MPARPTILDRGRVALERAIDQLPLYLGLRPNQADLDPIETASQNRAFQFLIRLARELLGAATVGEALERTLDVAFEALPVHRGFVLLRDRHELRCEILRVRDHVEHRPAGMTARSDAIIQRVMTERVGLCTGDALADERFPATDSIWLHGIRAAMCVPLWSGDEVMGVLQVDSPVLVGAFAAHDLDFLMALANLAATAVGRIREREARLRLQRYHAPAVVDEIVRSAGVPAEQWPLVRADLTVLFADLAGFTTLSETMRLEEVAALLSGFCGRVADAVFAEGGTVDKLMGDCVMAFFGAPIASDDHAARGVRAALRIHAAMAAWNRDRVPAGLPPLQVRIGLHSGPAVVGDVGSPERVDYTAIGTTVNVAARLEQQVAEPGDIVFSEATRTRLQDEFVSEPLGSVALRGLEHGVNAFRMRGSALESWHMAL